MNCISIKLLSKDKDLGGRAVTHLVNPPLAALVSPMGAGLLLFQSNSLLWPGEGNGGWPRCLGSCTHMGDQEEAPGSWLRISEAPAIVAVWGEGRPFSLSVPVPIFLPLCFSKYIQRKKRQREVFHLLVHSPDGRNDWS